MAIFIGGNEIREVIYTYPGARRVVTAIYVGNEYVWPKIEPLQLSYRSDNGEQFSGAVEIPWWAASIDLVLLGSGGGGAGGDGSIRRSGRAGSPGQWRGFTIARTPGEPATLDYTINAGGAGGAKEKSGGAGGATIATFEGVTYTAPGGDGGSGYGSADSGIDPGNFTWNGTQWTPHPNVYYMYQGYGGKGGKGGTFGNADPGSPGKTGLIGLYLFPSPEAQA